MGFENLINEIVSNTKSIEIEPVNRDATSDTPVDTTEMTTDIQNDCEAESLAEKIKEFESERAKLHAKIIGTDQYGRTISDWCGCNNAGTHIAVK